MFETETIAVVTECTVGSDDGRVNFPQVVQRLAAAGVESYFTDLRQHLRVYYLPSGESHPVAGAKFSASIAKEFYSAGVAAAVRDAQAARVDYKTFCRESHGRRVRWLPGFVTWPPCCIFRAHRGNPRRTPSERKINAGSVTKGKSFWATL